MTFDPEIDNVKRNWERGKMKMMGFGSFDDPIFATFAGVMHSRLGERKAAGATAQRP